MITLRAPGYLLGTPYTRFAVTRQRPGRWGWPWRSPRGGWSIGPVIVWWSV